jgi:hypothetical protein
MGSSDIKIRIRRRVMHFCSEECFGIMRGCKMKYSIIVLAIQLFQFSACFFSNGLRLMFLTFVLRARQTIFCAILLQALKYLRQKNKTKSIRILLYDPQVRLSVACYGSCSWASVDWSVFEIVNKFSPLEWMCIEVKLIIHQMLSGLVFNSKADSRL